MTWMPSTNVYYLITKKEVHKQFTASVSWIPVTWHHNQGWIWIRSSADRYNAWTRQKTTLYSGHYLRNRSNLDIGVLGYIGVFNIRNTLPKSVTFLLGHPVYIDTLLLIEFYNWSFTSFWPYSSPLVMHPSEREKRELITFCSTSGVWKSGPSWFR